MIITDIKGTVSLNNAVKMPYVGLGLFQNKNESEIDAAIKNAWNSGYRLFDTASIYKNEIGVGKAIKHLYVNRNEIFVTSKVWNRDQGYDTTLKAFEESLQRLNLEYLDLYLIHWPVEGRYIQTWKALEELYKTGKVKAIGVSNFLMHHLEDILDKDTICPMVNQIEYHPWLLQHELIAFCQKNKIQVQGWAPLMKGKVFEIRVITDLAKKYNKSAVQIVLRWNLQKGVLVIPKSVNKERIETNCDIFNFSINDADMHLIDALNKNERIGPDPGNFNF